MGPWTYITLHELTTLYYYERWICGVRFLSAKSLEEMNKLIWNGAEHFSGADAGNGGVASCGVSHFRGQSLFLRLRLLRCTRHSLRRCWPSLLQRMLHWGFHRFHFWEWQVHVQGNSLTYLTAVSVKVIFFYFFFRTKILFFSHTVLVLYLMKHKFH